MFAASGSANASAPGGALPPDERLAEPGTRYEIIDGERVHVPPADEPHATEHFALGYLLAAHVAPGYRGALDMLTRTSETSDFAPDASVFAGQRDPATGGRRLEEIAFEIASTQSRASATRKARGLTERGVRRVFCLDLRRHQVLEWHRAAGDWRVFAADDVIDDSCFVRPLPVAALLDAAARDDAVARALLAKRNPVIERALAEGEARARAEGEARGRAEGEARGRAEGEARGRAEGVMRVLETRGFEVPGDLRAHILACADLERLDRWLARALTVALARELIDERE
jgi:Uma2 family endonuclease